MEIPRFKFDQTLNVIEILRGMGINKVFTPKGCDGFLGIFKTKQAGCVTNFTHKVCVSVDEIGVEAAAISSISISRSLGRKDLDYLTLRLNRPFLFFIVDEESRLILFSGVYRGYD